MMADLRWQRRVERNKLKKWNALSKEKQTAWLSLHYDLAHDQVGNDVQARLHAVEPLFLDDAPALFQFLTQSVPRNIIQAYDLQINGASADPIGSGTGYLYLDVADTSSASFLDYIRTLADRVGQPLPNTSVFHPNEHLRQSMGAPRVNPYGYSR